MKAKAQCMRKLGNLMKLKTNSIKMVKRIVIVSKYKIEKFNCYSGKLRIDWTLAIT